jgi:hypothetical protein
MTDIAIALPEKMPLLGANRPLERTGKAENRL